jgi:hypothetical protein
MASPAFDGEGTAASLLPSSVGKRRGCIPSSIFVGESVCVLDMELFSDLLDREYSSNLGEYCSSH